LIVAARAVGKTLGASVLVVLGPRTTMGHWLGCALLVFALSLLSFSLVPWFPVALVLVAIAGAASVMVDTLEQTALQAAVEKTARGRAAGLWVLMIGAGPIGVLEIGIVAQILGARFAQASSSALVLMFAIILTGRAGARLRGIRITPSVIATTGDYGFTFDPDRTSKEEEK
jgi:hypothetical protein